MEPFYKGQVGDGSFVTYIVEPLYKGQVGDGSFVTYIVEPLYKGQVGDGSFVTYIVEPLYKGQVGDGSFVPCTVEPLHKGQVPLSPVDLIITCTMKVEISGTLYLDLSSRGCPLFRGPLSGTPLYIQCP